MLLRNSKKGHSSSFWEVLLWLGLCFWIFFLGSVILVWVTLPVPLEKIKDLESSSVILDRKGEWLCTFLSEREEYVFPMSLNEMGKWLPLVARELEDRRFFMHRGVDLPALFREFVNLVFYGRTASGASTITAQLIRLVEPRSRNIWSKFVEFVLSLKLEEYMSKEEILEAYLNWVPVGSNLRGVEAGSRYYFGKAAQELSLSEACVLVGLFPRPEKLRPDYHPGPALEKRNRVLEILYERGIIGESEYRDALSSKLPGRAHPFPQLAYHASLWLKELLDARYIQSTIDGQLQEWIERIASNYLLSFGNEITLACLVVDNRTAEILAYLGNARWGEKAPGGWVDCARALRSPGSTLKPFAYLIAFERGLLVPSSILSDVPWGFAGGVPRNFDEKFRGPVTAREALAASLNVPAVRLGRKIGYEFLLSYLREMGFSHLTGDPEFYGDALLLGGCEVSLLEMVQGYLVLATLGKWRPLQILRGTQTAPWKNLATKEASFLVTDILAERVREEIRNQRNNRSLFAFKTGTSSGLRDAWTICYHPRYTAAIWMGDPRGRSHVELVGARSAFPIARKIMEYLLRGNQDFYSPPAGIVFKKVCPVSGKLSTEQCPASVLAPFIKDVSPLERCDLHTGFDGNSTAFGSSLQGVWYPQTVSIISPVKGKKYLLRTLQEAIRIPLSFEGMEEVFWFVDGEFVGKAQPRETLFVELGRGKHRISLCSQKGVVEEVVFEIGTPEKGTDIEKVL